MLWKVLLVTGALYVVALAISFVVALAAYKGNSHLRHHEDLDAKPV
jgi:hypothetical protein